MNKEIANVQLRFNCPANWDAMTPINGGRYCTQCNKIVYDFTDARQQEFLQILAECGGNLCGRFRQEQVALQPVVLRGWKRWASAALMLLGISVFQQANAQQKTPQKAGIKVDKKAKDDLIMLGDVEILPQPSFPGGNDGLMNFLKQNIHYPKGAVNGKVFASFIVSKAGKITDIKIMRGLNSVTDAEVIRVLKLMPDWIPGTINGKPADITYTLPVAFAANK
ncbi:protein TonB [Mucilaginibacter yixingensis]|uniref:Protein TonB n=1 Tax=Mucilaginibacter yixingensis TaxID=1295612 RepID=A0A2T5J7M4_9SPHI|nr:energy transducer TonB [Mucilaginibacter yixingensis]PTQ95148.1 protein TonB [Mucilaginibacter yixingensis]